MGSITKREHGQALLAGWGVAPEAVQERQPDILTAALTPKRQRAPSLVPSEYQEQCAVLDWWDRGAARRYGVPEQLLFMIPNGLYLGNDHKARMVRVVMAKRSGLRPGAPDLMLAVARGQSKGLFVEMKRTDAGRPSSEQLQFHDDLKAQGYEAHFAYGADAAIEVIKAYLG